MTPAERVLVVPRDRLFGGEAMPQGFGTEGLEAIHASIARHAFFVERGPAEEDASLQQLIPYGVVERDGQVLGLVRTRRQTESRLHDRFSIGVGGHVGPEDAPGGLAPGQALDTRAVLGAGFRRELAEELRIPDPCDREAVGYVKDDSEAVGRVHFGLVYRVRARGEVSVRETDRMHGRFYTAAELAAHYERMETWSRMVYDALLRPAARPATR